jgi:hypothetical protein
MHYRVLLASSHVKRLQVIIDLSCTISKGLNFISAVGIILMQRKMMGTILITHKSSDRVCIKSNSLFHSFNFS